MSLRRSLALLAVAAAIACGKNVEVPSATAPAVAFAPSPTPRFATHTLSGAVFESTPHGVHGVSGANISIWAQEGLSGHHVGSMVSDSNGTFRLLNMYNAFIVLYADKPGYRQPCAAAFDFRADTEHDIEIVPMATLLAGVPSRLRDASPTISGVVFEETPEGRTPVAGAEVSLEWIPDLLTAWTISDGDGRYTLCRVPAGLVDVGAVKSGYFPTDLAVRMTDADVELDLQLRRR